MPVSPKLESHPSRDPRRIGLFGGSFDPVHNGHLLVAQAAQEELELDRIVFIPAAQSPFKPGSFPAPAASRLRYLRLALAGRPSFQIDDQELRRGSPSYTIDTVREYAALFPLATLFYLIGADHVSQLPKWRDATDLAMLAEFVAVPRPGHGESTPAPAPFRVRILHGIPTTVSSLQVRRRVRARLPIDLLVPSAVAQAIEKEHTYTN